MKIKIIMLLGIIMMAIVVAGVGISLVNLEVEINETLKDVLDAEDFNYTYVDYSNDDYVQRTIIVEGYCGLPQSSEPHYYSDYKGNELNESLNAYMVKELEEVATQLDAGACDIKPTEKTGEGNITLT